MGWFDKKYWLPLAWIAALIVCGLILKPNFLGWLVIAFVAYLIHPKFWPYLEGSGKFFPLDGRVVIAAIGSVLLTYAAWERALDKGLLGLSAEERAVAASMKDPASAMFRNIRRGTSATCGEVNGKNGFGAYAGFKPFVYEYGVVYFEPEEPVGFNIPEQMKYHNEKAEFYRTQRRCYE